VSDQSEGEWLGPAVPGALDPSLVAFDLLSEVSHRLVSLAVVSGVDSDPMLACHA